MDVDDPDGTSPEVDPPEVDPAGGASPEVDPPPFAWPAAVLFVEVAEDRRSFLAQPLPLKWIVGGANARVTAPSQSGHWWGPDSLRPWKTSNRWRQEVQT